MISLHLCSLQQNWMRFPSQFFFMGGLTRDCVLEESLWNTEVMEFTGRINTNKSQGADGV